MDKVISSNLRVFNTHNKIIDLEFKMEFILNFLEELERFNLVKKKCDKLNKVIYEKNFGNRETIEILVENGDLKVFLNGRKINKEEEILYLFAEWKFFKNLLYESLKGFLNLTLASYNHF